MTRSGRQVKQRVIQGIHKLKTFTQWGIFEIISRSDLLRNEITAISRY